MKKLLPVILFIAALTSCAEEKNKSSLAWPETENTHKPWTRWWWHGNSVTEAGITHELKTYYDNGFGGFELTPIYGVIGDEENFIDFLSSDWVEMLEYTLLKASDYDMGIDIATGTGWPFGGPWIQEEHTAKYVKHKVYEVSDGNNLSGPVYLMQEPYYRHIENAVYKLYDKDQLNYPDLLKEKVGYTIDDIEYPVSDNENLQALAIEQVRYEKPMELVSLQGYNITTGETVDLMEHYNAETQLLDWKATDGDYKIYAVFMGWHGKMVERAAPGGEGLVIDHFSEKALDVYLEKFDEAFKNKDISSLRAFFNDSYEVDDAFGSADFTDNFLEAFETRRGYDLKPYFAALFDQDSSDLVNDRVLIDYNRTISDLLKDEFTVPWRKWAHKNNAVIRNQAHGSPANIIDLYAQSDIPETEGTNPVMIKYASSASHLTGKQLTGAEASTWLDEHFLSNLSDVKANVDRYFTGGINHIVYHGSCYSPVDDEWPGRLFYAAIHANPRNPMWNSFKVLNQYVTRTQSFLQNSTPDNDILVYYPVFDRYADRGNALTQHFIGRGPSYENSTMLPMVNMLLEEGYTFDFVTDELLADLNTDENGKIKAVNNSYRTILIPECTYFDVETLEKLQELTENGANIIFQNKLPEYALGMANIAQKQDYFEQLKTTLTESNNGSVYAGSNLQELLTQTGVFPENMVRQGFRFIRKKYDNETLYFINNNTDQAFEGWVPFNDAFQSVAVMNPMTGKTGVGNIKKAGEGDTTTHVYLRAKPGESFIVRGLTEGKFKTGPYHFYEDMDAEGLLVNGNVQLVFDEGGPELPGSRNLDNVQLWSDLESDQDILKSFSGTATYTFTFTFDPDAYECDAIRIDLGNVHETALVTLNDREVAHEIGPDYSFVVSKDAFHTDKDNVLQVQVSNLMANRIAYMDRKAMPWKKFYNINISANKREDIKHGLFNAAHWEPLPSGMEGPISIQPVVRVTP